MSEEIKKIIEESKSEEELLENLDKAGCKQSGEELEAVAGGAHVCVPLPTQTEENLARCMPITPAH